MAIVAVGSNSPPAGVRENRFRPSWQSPDRPAPTMKANGPDSGRGDDGGAGNVVVDDQPERTPMTTTTKPAYRVPTMGEIGQIPWNGYTVASTFSGCGGSSLGYRMAGYRVVYASEFIPAAQDTYRANAAPHTYLDTRDIRTVTADDLMERAGLVRGQLDLLDGSPPCASFSTSGKRSAGWGKSKKYSDSSQRTDDLFYEFARILDGVQPRVFVAENVSGLIKGVAKGYFIRIMQRLRDCGYRVEAKVLDAQWLGVPQARQRLIFVGVRNDLARKPAYPTPLPYRYAVREVLGGERYVHDTSGQRSVGNFTDRPAPTITVGVGMGDKGQSINSLHYRVITKASYDETTPRVYPGTGPSPAITASGVGAAHRRGEVALETPTLITHDPETGKDLRIDRFAIGREYAKLQQGEVSRKYLNLIRGDESRPAFSVTATGGQVAAAGPVHATVARKFTLGELRRLCAFPDDFVLKGTYEQRWERLGRAVPPVMMREIALAVKHQILDTLKEGEP